MRYLVFIFCGLISLAVTGQSTIQPSQNKGPGMASYTFKVAYTDTYVFRGHVFENDNTAIGEAGVGIGKWSYNLWYAEPQNNTLGILESEFNHSISYTTLTRGRVTTVGYQIYKYKGMLEDTQEFFTRIRHLTKWQPTYGLYYDIDTYKGYYLDFAFSRDMPLSRKSNLHFRLKGGLAYDMEPKTRDVLGPGGPVEEVVEEGFFGDDGFTSGSFQVKYTWAPLDWLSMEAGGEYHYAFDDFLFANNPALERDTTLWKAGLTVRFP